jgi:TolB protein
VPGIGVAACQSGVDNTRENQMLVYNELRKGTSPARILEMLKLDPNIERRQFGILAIPNGSTITAQNHMVGFNGASNSPSSLFFGGQVGDIYYQVQGNTLLGTDVVYKAALAITRASGTMADRVMAGMEAADENGGDKRCNCGNNPVTSAPCDNRTAHVAYITIANKDDQTGETHNDGKYFAYITASDADVAPGESANPVKTLRMRYEAWKRAGSNRTAPPGPTMYRPLQSPGPNPLNLWVVDLKWTGSQLSTGIPVKLTNDNGTNSQPSFSPDGKSVVFSATRDSGSSEIYRIDLATRTETRITRTPENENSPTVNQAGEYVAVRWVPATLFKEYGVWMYSADGTPTRGVLRGPDTTGYYTPLESGDYSLTRPKSKTFTIALFDDQSGTITDVDSGVPALPAQLIPGQRALSYVRIDTADGKHTLRRVDLATKRTTSIGATVVGRTAHAWIPRHNTVLMAKGSVLYARGAAESSWRVVARFDDRDLRNANAYVVSPNGDKLVLTSPKRLALNVVLRDSLEAGHTGAAVAAMAIRWREAGQLADVDVSENPISALGDDRLQRNRFADAVALHTLATTFFPRSYRAPGRLGDAQRAAGDSAGALASYRRALELNPRATEADRTAAAAIERKISGKP